MMRPSIRPWLLLGAAALVAIAALALGYPGGFLLDDSENLVHVQRYLEGSLTLPGALFANASGLLRRPLSMLSFIADAGLFGLKPGPMKLTNIGLHVACGVALFGLLRQVFIARGERRDMVAAAIAGIWLLLPVHVGTVLYVVQRMTVLSALFVMLALSAYFVARNRMQQQREGAWIWLWVLFPLATVLAIAGKENGVLAIPLAFCAELTLFANVARPRHVRSFFVLALGVPLAALAAVLLLRPDTLLGSYVQRPFTLAERLLTESRIVWRYVADVLLPDGRHMGLFHDDYVRSTSVFAPPATAIALGGWVAVAAFVLRFRTRLPLTVLGLLWFVVGHSLESTILPLELYFEHRNYLPSVGLLLAAAGLLLDTGIATRHARIIVPGIAAIALGYGVATAARASVWRDSTDLLAHALRHNPESLRLRSSIAFEDMLASRFDDAFAQLDAAEPLAHEGSQRASLALWRTLAHCYAGTPPPASLYDALGQAAHGRIDQGTQRAFELVIRRAEPGDCPGIDAPRLADIGLAWTDATPQARREQSVWATETYMARLVGSTGDLARAAAIADRAFADSGYEFAPGILAFQMYASLEDVDAQARVVAQLRKHVPYGDRAAAEAVEHFDAHVQSQRTEAAPRATPSSGEQH